MSASVTATFVFTDLVDSTATAARLGPAAAEELRQTHFRLLRGAVSASGGTEVKNLGDGLMVMYTSPTRALACAVGMQQAIEHHNRSDTEPLGVRIGMSTGEAVEEDGDYFGDSVVVAARLCAAAEGGQILAADLVRLMVGTHTSHTFVEVGGLELKGLAAPVPAVEVSWDPVEIGGSAPLPARLVGAAANAMFGFFGRDSEVAALHEARKLARANGCCQLVFVAGEAGMGKTALVAQVARTAHAEGAIVLFGHADEDLGVTYQPWIEVVSSLVRDGDAAWVSGLRAAQRGALARLVPEIGSDAERVADPEMERLLLLEGTTELLATASKQAPVLVVLDDLHWADTASLQLLRHVIGSSTQMDVTITCTYRDTDLGRGDPLTNLLSDFHRQGNVTRIALAGLEDDELIELMAAAAGHELDDRSVGLAHALRRETDGNPFFSTEMLRHLGESGGIVPGADGRWTVAADLDELAMPTSVRDVVGRRVERFGDEAVRVLCLAAVIGREFDISVLARVADIDEDPLLDLMDAAVGAAVLVDSGGADRYRFAHALIQHSLYEELSPSRRQRAHQRVGESLESHATTEDAATLAELAHHWIAATRPTDFDKALGYARRAGDAARAALAPDDAIRWYEQTLELVDRGSPPDRRVRAELLALLGAAQNEAGVAEWRDTLVEAAALALDLDDSNTLVLAVLGFAMSPGAQVGDDTLKPFLRAALDRVAADATATRARLLAALVLTHDAAAEWRERRELALQAVEAARVGADDATVIDVIDLTRSTLATPDRIDHAIDDFERAARLADQLGDLLLRARSRAGLVWCRYQQADLVAADRALAEMEALTEAIGLRRQDYEYGQYAVGRLLLAGNADEAEAANERLLELGTAASVPHVLPTFGGVLFAIRHHQGRLDEIADFFFDAARDNPSLAALRSAALMMLCELGRIEEARALLATEAAAGFDFPYDSIWLTAMSNLTDAAATVQDQAAARELIDRLTPYANQVIVPLGPVVNGAMARPLARCATVLGDYDQAEEWFTIAHDIHARLPAPYWTARAQLDHADLCLTRRADGDLERARDLATTAAATAAEFGCAGLTKRAEALLALL